ncbi:hypothetical protein EIN_051540 [Entamoeba invadens IP1]|uniref:hypothetical protein n=1 Tax=Entamoeba invadens IP1 TaxID=370355 RepID=UPI0002C3E6BD|nr:hypothetical protein EIN_051540 [Entamoeba invadens IP1]ELP92989.1 hypothetical protein EIN_051540 [Entamoeba invadens IP1]|eukprot:XP_004259760.1 hypothetical protein EIN_051540 [Entamoeba invadens IP1]
MFFLFLLLCALSVSKFSVYVFDVGMADSQLIVYPSGYSILIDLGEELNNHKPTNAEYVATRVEEILGKKELDVVVLTHLHTDHYGYYNQNGLWHLFNVSGFTAKKYIDRDFGVFTGDSTYGCDESSFTYHNVGEYTKAMLLYGCQVQNTKKLSYLSTIREQASENDYSIGLRIKYGNFVYCTAGDLGGKYTTQFDNTLNDIESTVSDIVGSVDVMHANHHGSASSNNQKWLDALTPTVTLISCGKANSYNLPSTAASKRFFATSKLTISTEQCNTEVVGETYQEFNSDIIISVDKSSSKKFTVSNKDNSFLKSFDIKLNKPEKAKCRNADPDDSKNGLQPTVVVAFVLIFFAFFI